MLAGHAYKIVLQASTENTSWIPAIFVARYSGSEVVSAQTLTAGQIELVTYWRTNSVEVKPGDTLEAEIPGFPGPSASATIVSVEDTGLLSELPTSWSPWPIVGAAAIFGFVVYATIQIKRRRSR